MKNSRHSQEKRWFVLSYFIRMGFSSDPQNLMFGLFLQDRLGLWGGGRRKAEEGGIPEIKDLLEPIQEGLCMN